MTTLVGSAAGALAVFGLGTYAVRGRSSALFAPSVYHGDRSHRAIALTFDDGPSESTPALLEILAAHKVAATFFMCGASVRRLPAIAREVAAAGHEIGNHTDSHPHLVRCSPAGIQREMDAAQQAIQQATGATPRLFRAPFGERWFGLRAAQQRLNLLGVMWTVIVRDWVLTGPAAARRLLAGASNGGILCLHDGRRIDAAPDIRATLEAVRRVLPELQERGFEFETVSQILCPTT